MDYKFTTPSIRGILSLPTALVIFTLFISLESMAQEKRAVTGERATCVIKIPVKSKSNEKVQPRDHKAELNQMGYFDKITDIPPRENIPVEIYYPDGAPGEKVVIMVKDGGLLDNGNIVKVAELDHEQKLSFDFQVTDHPGMHQVMLKKDMDIKVVQLWVGPEAAPTKK